MNSPFDKIRRGATALALIVILAVVGFRVVADYDWIEALWMVIITVSTVGYSEHSGQGWATQLLSIAVILLGTTAARLTSPATGVYWAWTEKHNNTGVTQ